jgi:hypothetical protein
MADNHAIIIRPEPFGVGFDITVEPAPTWANFNVERPTIGAARRYACGLATVHKWRIVDQSGEAA